MCVCVWCAGIKWLLRAVSPQAVSIGCGFGQELADDSSSACIINEAFSINRPEPLAGSVEATERQRVEHSHPSHVTAFILDRHGMRRSEQLWSIKSPVGLHQCGRNGVLHINHISLYCCSISFCSVSGLKESQDGSRYGLIISYTIYQLQSHWCCLVHTMWLNVSYIITHVCSYYHDWFRISWRSSSVKRRDMFGVWQVFFFRFCTWAASLIIFLH